MLLLSFSRLSLNRKRQLGGEKGKATEKNKREKGTKIKQAELEEKKEKKNGWS